MAQNYVGQRSGLVDASASTSSRQLFLKLYAGEVMTAFQTKNIMMNYTRTRNIKKGKSAQFIMTGKHRTAGYHTPGAEIVPNVTAKQTERVVSIDDLLIVNQFIPNIDEAMSQYDIRSVYSAEAAYGLAYAADKNILRMAIKAGLSTSAAAVAALVQENVAWTDEDFSANVTYASLANSVKSMYFMEGVIEAKRILESAGAPLDDLVCVVATDIYYHMFKSQTNSETTANLHLFNQDVGGSGSVKDVNLPTIAGIPVVRTPHLGTGGSSGWATNLWTMSGSGASRAGIVPSADRPLGATESNRTTVYDLPAAAAYGGEGEKVRAIIMNKDAVATVKLLDLSVETDYMVNRQGTMIVSKYAMGHNVLRPAMSVLLVAPVS
jgi:hypothetical protein